MSTLAEIDGQRIVVYVDDVDLTNRLAHCRDKTKATLKVSLRDSSGGAFRVPASGERWTAVRSGPIWRFESRLDSPAEHSNLADNLEPGDTRLDAAGALHVLSESILFNGQPIGATTYSAFTSNGSVKSFDLGAVPVHQRTIMAFINGLLIDPRTFTINGSIVTFVSAPASGVLIVYFQRAGFVYEDGIVMRAVAVVSAIDIGPYADTGVVVGHSEPSATGSYTPNGGSPTGSP